jgi:UDP-N-acetylglucosamine--N-acetylmuramyl-(pentapeptide) pyrophosphoryl-undecaprenol N-acetylglucosamine transferase
MVTNNDPTPDRLQRSEPPLAGEGKDKRSGAPLVLVTAGGTGGHLFPAEALSIALRQRGVTVDLATDVRAVGYGGSFPARGMHVIPSATFRGSDPFAVARTSALLGAGVLKAWWLLQKLQPAAVVGFGGYPTIPPVLAAAWSKIPTIIHEQNRVLGRANKLLAPRVSAIATGFSSVMGAGAELAEKMTFTGNPVRPAVIAAAAAPYSAPEVGGALHLLVFGGSQGARIMSDIVPAAIERLEPALWARLHIVQQAREEDVARVRSAYAALRVSAEVAAFFPDLPARIAGSHLVVSRSGASTVAELGAIGRPAILVPLPGALDQDQMANAGVLEQAGGAIRLPQAEFTPDRLASEISALAAEPDRLAAMARAAHSIGTLDAAERLADLVLRVAAQGRA